METNIKKISDTFSAGDFTAVYPYMSDDVIWKVVGSNTIKGKPAVIEYCSKMLLQMEGAALVNTSHIAADGQVAVQGYCNYNNEDGSPGRVEYCDVYRFANNLLAEITSYCLDIKTTAK